MKQLRVIQQRKKCIGCNTCAEIHPQRWRMSKKDGKAMLVNGVNKKAFFRLFSLHMNGIYVDWLLKIALLKL